MADEQILDVLVTKFTADLGPLEAGLTKAETDAKRSGQQIGQQLGQGLKAGLTTGTNPEQLGKQQGQEWGEGWKIGADGRLRDAKGKFVKTGQDLGKSLTDGMTQGVKEGGRGLDTAVTGLTASLGGGAGGGLTGGFARLTAGAGGLSGGLTSIVGALGPVAAGITTVTTAVLASVAAVNRATNEYAKFEKGLAGVSTLTDKVPEQMGETGRAILNLSTDLGVSFQDLSAGLQDILGAGVKGTEDMSASLLFLKDASKLAIAGQTDTATATDALTTILNSYKLSAADTKAVSDGLFRTVQDGKISFNTLAGSIGNVTSIAADSGVSLRELNAAIATMTANGLQGSTAVDYLRSAITSIIKPSDEAQKLADKLGIQFDAQALKSKGLTGVLKDVQAATKGNTAEMAILFGGVEAMSAATSIASGNFDRMTTNLKNQAAAAGSTETAYAKMAGTLAKENDRVDANWKKLMVNLGEAFAPFKTSVLQGINEMLEGINKMLERWNLAKTVTSAGNNVLNLERQISERRDLIQVGEQQLAQFGATMSPATKKEIEARLAGARADLARMEAELTAAKAQMGAVKAEQSRYNVANSSALLPSGVQGPNMGGAPGASATIVVRGEDLQTLMGLGGKRTGTPYGQGYSFTKADGSVYSGTHNGEDIFAPKGTNVLAPFTGMLTARWSETTGNVIEMIDAAGNKLLLGHLDKYAAGLQDAIKKAGGQLLVQQGELIAHVGNTGNLTGRGDGNSHIHMMAYDKSGRIVNPLGTNFTAMQGDAYFTGSSASANAAAVKGGGSPPPGAPNKDDLKAYSLNLADWNKNQARALELAREAAKAESDLTGKRGLQVKAAMEKWAGEDKARQQSYQLAVQLTARQEQAAAKARTTADQQAREAEAREKEAQQRAARINEALRQGKIESARNELTRLQEMRTADLRSAGENAQKVAAVEKRYAESIFQAKKDIALAEKKDRDAGILNDKSLNADARALKLRNSNNTYLNAVRAAGNELNAAQDKIDKEATDKARAIAAQGVAITKSATDAVIAELTRRAEEIDRINSEINDAEIAAANARYANVNGAMDAAMRGSYGVGADGLAAALKGYGVRSVEELAGINPTAADSIRRVYADVFKQMAADLERAAQESLNIIEFYKEEADRLADQTAARAESGTRAINERDAQRVTTNTRAPSLMLSFLGGAGNEWFGDKFSQLGEEGRAAFLERLNAVTPDDFAAVPLALLKSVRAKIGDAKEWQGLKATLDTAIGKNLENSANAGGWKELGGMIEQINALDATSVTYSATLTGKFVPALEALRDRMTDPALKKAIDEVISGLGIQAANADALAAAHAELAAAMNTSTEPYAAQIKGLEALKKAMPEAAAEIDALIKKWKELGAQEAAIKQATQDTADYNAAQDALAKSSRELGAAMGQTDAPYQNQIDGLEELKTKMPKLAGDIDALIAKWEGLQAAMQVADIAGQIASAVTQFGALFDKISGSEAKGALSILGDWMTMNVTAYKQFKSGDVVGAVMTTINGVLNIGESIAELNSGLREWKKNLREIAEEQKKVLGMSTGGFKSPWEEALKKDAGNREQLANSKWYQRLWWGLTGDGPQAISDEAAKLLTDLQEIFAQLGDGIADAFTDAMLSAFEAGDMSQFADNFSKQFDAVVGKVVLKTMIEAALTQGAVADDLAALTKAIQEQRYGDVPPILASIKQKAGQIGAGIAAVAPSLPGYGGGSDGSGADNRALFGAAPTAQLGIPRFEVTIPNLDPQAITSFNAGAFALERAADKWDIVADRLIEKLGLNGLQRTTGLAPL